MNWTESHQMSEEEMGQENHDVSRSKEDCCDGRRHGQARCTGWNRSTG